MPIPTQNEIIDSLKKMKKKENKIKYEGWQCSPDSPCYVKQRAIEAKNTQANMWCPIHDDLSRRI